MSLVGKTLKSTFKSLLNSSSDSTGIDTTARNITDGEGTPTAISLSDDVLAVQPQTDQSAGTFKVSNLNGAALFSVNSSDGSILSGIGQHQVNTQYAHFGVASNDAATLGFSANTHYMIPFGSANSFGVVSANYALGTATDPATSLTISDTAYSVARCYWYVPDTIVIQKVSWWSAADAATGDTTRAHLMAYDVVTTAGGTSGDLSGGAVVAASSDVTNAGYEQAYYNEMSISVPVVTAGKVVLFTFRSDSVNSDYSINATIKYYIY